MATLSEFQTADQILRPIRTLKMAWNIQDKIQDLKTKIAKLEEEKAEIVKEHLQIGLKKDGPFSINEKRRARRKVDEVYLEAQDPELFDRISEVKRTVSVKALDDAIGKTNAAQYCITTEAVEYEIDWDYKYGVEQ